MYYTRLEVVCDPAFSEILIAEMSAIGFDSFLETDNGFEAYAEEEKFDREALAEIRSTYHHVNPLGFSEDRIEKMNWNEEWEKNTQPIIVDDQCIIRPEFHKPDKKYPYEIVITPKMSFGTGHHQTTYLMIGQQLTIDHSGKKVMDAGCGTAILSIMAAKRGAKEIDAFDIDEWSASNGKENIENNDCQNIRLKLGTIRTVKLSKDFDLILANINKNVLLNEMEVYADHLLPKGQLLLSGFYTQDIEDLKKESSKFGFREVRRADREGWAALLLEKV